MQRAMILVLIASGCTSAGDDLGAPRLARRASDLVYPVKLAFDDDNRPLALLGTDVRQQLSRLTPQGWTQIEGTEPFNVLDVGAAADGSLLFTAVDTRPGSGLFELGIADRVNPLGGRIPSALSFEPFQSPWGDLFVSTVDGGRRLVSGSDSWELAKTLTQVARSRSGTVYGINGDGVIKMDLDDRASAGVLVLACDLLPAGCARTTFAGVDSTGRLFFTGEGRAELFVLDPGASELRPIEIPGANAIGSVRTAPGFTVIEVIVTDSDRNATDHILMTRRAGADQFQLVDMGARPELSAPLLAVDRNGRMFVADRDWFGTIDLD